MKSFAIVQSSPPYANASGIEALDMSMLLGSFEIPITLFLLGDGIYQILQQQEPEAMGHKNFSKTFGALSFYDIDKIYVDEQSLLKRGISKKMLIENVEVVSQDVFHREIDKKDYVVTF